MPSAFIDDGYTLSATLPGKEGAYDSFRITYRPLVRSEHFRYANEVKQWFDKEDRIDRQHLGDLDSLYADIFSGNNGWVRKLLDWDLSDSRGNPVEITSDNLLMLHPDAFSNLIDVFFPGEDKQEDTAKN